ncbi:MAG: lipocalin family protein [Pseudoxanthomonas sp.]|nr:lipocalin family protein [Pseudoxanthomonas sp.]
MRSLTALLLLLWMAPPAWAAKPVTSVPELDISRYAGQWYEIARLPMTFQNKCVGDVTAAYTLRDDDLIGVRNSCRTQSGEITVSEGVARSVAGHPGRLQVRFAPEWLSWAPFVWADYWIIDKDPGYTWAVVGEPGRDYLWILSREPGMDRALFEQIKARTVEMGYDLNPLILSGPLR